MARINIEDSIFKDERFIKLCIALGSRQNAIGALTCLWIEAQKHYLKLGEIPDEDWVKADLNEQLVICGLAKKTLTGFKAAGQDEQFAWLKQSQEAGKLGGKASAASRLEKNGTAIPQNAKNTPIEASTEPGPSVAPKRHRSVPNPLPLSLPLSQKEKEEELTTLSTGVDDAGRFHPVVEIWNSNCNPLPVVKKMNAQRLKRCRILWKRNSDPRTWAEQIKQFLSHPHNTGSNDRNWVATFDFFLKEEIQTRIVEGYYAGKSANGKTDIDAILKRRGYEQREIQSTNRQVEKDVGERIP